MHCISAFKFPVCLFFGNLGLKALSPVDPEATRTQSELVSAVEELGFLGAESGASRPQGFRVLKRGGVQGGYVTKGSPILPNLPQAS